MYGPLLHNPLAVLPWRWTAHWDRSWIERLVAGRTTFEALLAAIVVVLFVTALLLRLCCAGAKTYTLIRAG